MPQAPPNGWTLTGNALTRTVQRADFVEAMAFVLEVARLAEGANHHPDIAVSYKTVQLSLTTHDAGHKVTTRDFALARKINALKEESLRLSTRRLRRRLAV